MPTFSSVPSQPDILDAMRSQGTFVDITPRDAGVLLETAQAMALERLRRSVRVEDLMTASPLVLHPDEPAAEAARKLARAGVSGAPVARDGRVLGVVSVKNFLGLLGMAANAPPIALASALLDGAACGISERRSALVSGIMSSPAVCIAPEACAFEASAVMARHGVSRLPVLRGEQLVGILSRSDLVRAFGDLLEARP